MSYVVLARKWRPQQFEEVVGQRHVAQTLRNAIEQQRIAHSFLFTGARGVGKTSMARILAKALNCETGPTTHPCDQCAACTEIVSGSSVDVYEIDGASNRGINEIRELRDNVRYAPSRDRTKIYIIDEVHMLTTEAFNALLKTLEEPPEHVKFVFATTEPQKIPVTILSRCQRYDFKRIGQEDIVSHLSILCEKESIETSTDALRIIARQATGGMRDALSLLDQIISFAGQNVTESHVSDILGVASRKHVFDIGEAVLTGDPQRVLELLRDIDSYGYDVHELASELVQHFRDIMVVHVVDHPAEVSDLASPEIERIQSSLSALDLHKRTAAGLLQRCFSLMVEGTQKMGRSPHPSLQLEMTLLHLAQLEPIPAIDSLVRRLEDLESGAPTRAPSSVEGPRRSADRPRPSAPPRERQNARARTEHSSAPTPPTAGETVPSPARRTQSVAKPTAAEEVPPAAAKPEESAGAPSTPTDLSTNTPVKASTEPSDPPSPPQANEPAVPVPDASFDERSSRKAAEPSSNRNTSSPSGASIDALEFPTLIAEVRKTQPSLGASMEHARVLLWSADEIRLRFEEKNVAVIDLKLLETEIINTVQHLASLSPRVVIETDAERDTQAPLTIAEERDIQREERRNDVYEQLVTDRAVQEAQELFDVQKEDVRVQVNLFDE